MSIDRQDRIWHLNLSGQLYFIENGRVFHMVDYKYSDYNISSFKLLNDEILVCAKGGETYRAIVYSLHKNELIFKKEIAKGFNSSYLYPISNDTSTYLIENTLGNSNIYELDKNYRISNKINQLDYNLKISRIISKDKIVGKKKNKLVLINKGTEINEVGSIVNFHVAEIFDSVCWLLSEKGMQAVDISKDSMYLEKPILSNYKILSLFEDLQGNFWVGTKNSGLLFIPKMASLVFNTGNSNLTSDHISTLSLSDSNELFIGLENGDIARFKNGDITIIDENFGRDVNDIVIDKNQLFVASNDCFSKYNMITRKVSKIKSTFKDIGLGQSGNILLAAYNSTISIPNSSDSPDKAPFTFEAISLNRSYATKIDKKDRLWAGTIRGLIIYENEHVDTILNYSISDIEIVNDSIAYVATFANGVYRLINFKVDSVFNKMIKSSSNTISDIYFSNDTLYIATAKGLDVVNTLNNKVTYINKSSGLPTKEIRASVSDKNHLWVATNKGLCKIPKSKIRPPNDQSESQIRFNRIAINKRDTQIIENYALDKEQRYIDIQFSTPDYSGVELTDFYYRLFPHDTIWNLAYANKARINNLPYGQSQFEIYALNRNTLERTNTKRINFRVQTPLVHKFWFRACILLLFFYLSFILWTKYITHKYQKENQLLIHQRQVDGLRLTALQNQMNPHFISNSLLTIQNFIDKDKRWQALAFTSKFSAIVRHTMHMSTLERISIDEEILFLKKYISLEETRFHPPLECNFLIDNNILLNKILINIPPLIIQPIIENVFKHASLETKEIGKLKISLKSGKDHIICEILDNGLGIKDWNKEMLGYKSNSTGIRTVKERLALNAQQLRIKVSGSELFKIERVFTAEELYTKATLKIYYPKLK